MSADVVEAFFGVLRDGGVERLDAIVTEDCTDADPLPGQPPGRPGVARKVMLFRMAHPDAQIVIEAIEVAAAGTRVTWRTSARGLGFVVGEATWRFTGWFEIEGGKIRSSRLERSERVG